MADSAEAVIRRFRADSFAEREKAVADLVEIAISDTEAVLGLLVRNSRSDDPEIRNRVRAAMARIYARVELGRGAPEHGIHFKSKLLTVEKKLATQPLVEEFAHGSPALKCGLKPGDVILSINGVRFVGEDSVGELLSFMALQQPGARVEMRYSRKVDGGREVGHATLSLGPAVRSAKLQGTEWDGFKKWCGEVERRFSGARLEAE